MFFSILAVVHGGCVNGIGDLDQNRSARYLVLGLVCITLHMLGTQYMTRVLDTITTPLEDHLRSSTSFDSEFFPFFFAMEIYTYSNPSLQFLGIKLGQRLKIARRYLA